MLCASTVRVNAASHAASPPPTTGGPPYTGPPQWSTLIPPLTGITRNTVIPFWIQGLLLL
jgi:hypothetical protein